MDKMSKEAIIAELRSESLLNQVRAVISSTCGTLEQAAQQRRPPDIFETRNIEFAAAAKIAAILGVELKPGDFAAPSPRDCGLNGGELNEKRDNIGSAYTRSVAPPQH